MDYNKINVEAYLRKYFKELFKEKNLNEETLKKLTSQILKDFGPTIINEFKKYQLGDILKQRTLDNVYHITKSKKAKKIVDDIIFNNKEIKSILDEEFKEGSSLEKNLQDKAKKITKSSVMKQLIKYGLPIAGIVLASLTTYLAWRSRVRLYDIEEAVEKVDTKEYTNKIISKIPKLEIFSDWIEKALKHIQDLSLTGLNKLRTFLQLQSKEYEKGKSKYVHKIETTEKMEKEKEIIREKEKGKEPEIEPETKKQEEIKLIRRAEEISKVEEKENKKMDDALSVTSTLIREEAEREGETLFLEMGKPDYSTNPEDMSDAANAAIHKVNLQLNFNFDEPNLIVPKLNHFMSRIKKAQNTDEIYEITKKALDKGNKISLEKAKPFFKRQYQEKIETPQVKFKEIEPSQEGERIEEAPPAPQKYIEPEEYKELIKESEIVPEMTEIKVEEIPEEAAEPPSQQIQPTKIEEVEEIPKIEEIPKKESMPTLQGNVHRFYQNFPNLSLKQMMSIGTYYERYFNLVSEYSSIANVNIDAKLKEFLNKLEPTLRSKMGEERKILIINDLMRKSINSMREQIRKRKKVISKTGKGYWDNKPKHLINNYEIEKQNISWFMLDELNMIDNRPNLTGIMNLDTSDMQGSHWVVFQINKPSGNLYYVDPLGIKINPIPKEIKRLAKIKNLELVYNKNQLMPTYSNFCGYISIYLAKLFRRALKESKVITKDKFFKIVYKAFGHKPSDDKMDKLFRWAKKFKIIS